MKIRYTLHIDAEVYSTGSWDDKCSLDQVFKQASDEALSMIVFMAKGTGAPVRIPAKITLDTINIDVDPGR